MSQFINPIYTKQPDEVKNYCIDFSKMIYVGDSINSATISVVPSDGTLNVSPPTISSSTTSVSGTVSGGTGGTAYNIKSTVQTTLGYTLQNDIVLFIETQNWQQESVIQLRVLINDLCYPPQYTDGRLLQVLLVAAKYIIQELYFTYYSYLSYNSSAGGSIYNVNIPNMTLTPDPTAQNDYTFVNMMTLKAACMIDQNALRAKAALAGLRANIGPASLNTEGYLKGFQYILEHGYCSVYDELKTQYAFGSPQIISAVLGPFSNNKFDARLISFSYYGGQNWNASNDMGFFGY